jgi:hypothetical protein
MALTLDNTSINSGQTVNITAWTLTVPAGSAPVLGTAARNAACDGIVDLVDAGVSGTGYVEIRDRTTVLVTIQLQDPAFGAAAAGVATLIGVPLSGTAGATGTADNYIAYDDDDNVIWTGSCA